MKLQFLIPQYHETDEVVKPVMEGMRMEAVTIDGWLKHIETLGRQRKKST